MKNFMKVLFILAVILFSYINKTEALSSSDYQIIEIQNEKSAIAQNYFNDKPLVISENNINQELSQSRNGNNNQITLINRHFFAAAFFNINIFSKKINNRRLNNNNYISTNLKNIIFTRAP